MLLRYCLNSFNCVSDRVTSSLMGRLDFSKTSDCTMLNIDMKELGFVYFQKARGFVYFQKFIVLTTFLVLFANYRCLIMFIKARRILICYSIT